MKKNLFFLIPALALVFVASSCNKDEPEPAGNNTEGKWNGTYTIYGGTPSYFSLHLKSGGIVAVEANNAATPDLGNGTYTVVGDSVKGSFIYTVGIGINYLFAGKYSSNHSVINGTIGISPSYSDNATFAITK
jgi:hypothetical protein